MRMFVSILAVASLITTPAAASVRDAAFASTADRTRAETSVFIGLHYGVSAGRTSEARGARASVQVARMVRTPDAQLRVGKGVGLAAGAGGRAALLVGGREIDPEDPKAKLSSGGTIAIVAVGVLALGAVIAYYALRDPCDYKECE